MTARRNQGGAVTVPGMAPTNRLARTAADNVETSGPADGMETKALTLSETTAVPPAEDKTDDGLVDVVIAHYITVDGVKCVPNDPMRVTAEKADQLVTSGLARRSDG